MFGIFYLLNIQKKKKGISSQTKIVRGKAIIQSESIEKSRPRYMTYLRYSLMVQIYHYFQINKTFIDKWKNLGQSKKSIKRGNMEVVHGVRYKTRMFHITEYVTTVNTVNCYNFISNLLQFIALWKWLAWFYQIGLFLFTTPLCASLLYLKWVVGFWS